MAAILEYFQFKMVEKLARCVFLTQRECDAANASAATNSRLHAGSELSSFTIWSLQNEHFLLWSTKKQIKTKLSAKYNHLIIHIQLVKGQHFYQQYIACAAK